MSLQSSNVGALEPQRGSEGIDSVYLPTPSICIDPHHLMRVRYPALHRSKCGSSRAPARQRWDRLGLPAHSIHLHRPPSTSCECATQPCTDQNVGALEPQRGSDGIASVHPPPPSTCITAATEPASFSHENAENAHPVLPPTTPDPHEYRPKPAADTRPNPHTPPQAAAPYSHSGNYSP